MKTETGFTLVELMIVIVIIGILMSIAIPGYQGFMMDGRRSEGQTALLDISARQEQFFLDNKSYTTNLLNLGLNASPFITEQGFYSVTAACYTDANGGCVAGYVLTAAPRGAQTGDGDLVINSIGTRSGDWN